MSITTRSAPWRRKRKSGYTGLYSPGLGWYGMVNDQPLRSGLRSQPTQLGISALDFGFQVVEVVREGLGIIYVDVFAAAGCSGGALPRQPLWVSDLGPGGLVS